MIAIHLVYGLDMIALSMGTALVVWSMKNPGKGSSLGKLFGGLVMIFSIISMICTFSCVMNGGACHGGPGHGEGMMMGPNPPPAPGEEMHEHMKKGEHKKA